MLRAMLVAAAILAAHFPCAVAQTTPAAPEAGPGTGRTGTVAPSRPGESLSERLSRTDGVLEPSRNPDPGMSKAPPPTASPMPVVPPPGTPGGDPSVDPK